MKTPTLTPGQKLAVSGSLLALAAAVLPWASLLDRQVPGYGSVDGFFTLMAAVTVLGVLALWPWGVVQRVVVTVFGVLIAGVTARYALVVGSVGEIGTEIGTYVGFVAGLLIVGGGGYAFVQRWREESADETPQSK